MIQMKKKLGTMIYETMLSRHIKQRELCAGLCSATAFSRYMNGERRMDRLLISVLLQRLGKSPDKFATLLTDEEYVYFSWKQKVCLAQIRRDWQEIDRLLQEEEAMDRNCNAVLQEQFYLIMQAIIREKVYQNREESVRLLKKAILLTVPGFERGIGKHIFLGVQEISAILLWQMLQPNREIALQTIEKLTRYIEIYYEDQQEKSKVYPKTLAQYLPLLYEKERYAECLTVARKALDIMISTGFTSGMEIVLSFYVEASEKIGLGETVSKQKVQLQVWRELMQEISPQSVDADEELYQLDVWQEIVLLHEMICLNRQEQGYTQEELSENICEPESLSRIETGKRSPNQRTYAALAKKLSLPEEYYFSAIETDDFQVLDMRWELEQLVMKRDWPNVEKTLERLAERLDLSIIQNRQYVEEIQFIVDQRLNRIRVEERFDRLMGVLGYTITELPQSENVYTWTEKFWMHPFTEREMSILIQISDVLRQKENTKQAIYLLEKMMACYQRSKVQPEYHYRIVILIVGRLSGYYGKLKDYQKELMYSENGIQLTIKCGNRKMMPLFLNNKADALENLGEKQTSLKYYKWAFYAAELLQTSTAAVAKRSYEKLINNSVEWYQV